MDGRAGGQAGRRAGGQTGKREAGRQAKGKQAERQAGRKEEDLSLDRGEVHLDPARTAAENAYFQTDDTYARNRCVFV